MSEYVLSKEKPANPASDDVWYTVESDDSQHMTIHQHRGKYVIASMQFHVDEWYALTQLIRTGVVGEVQ